LPSGDPLPDLDQKQKGYQKDEITGVVVIKPKGSLFAAPGGHENDGDDPDHIAHDGNGNGKKKEQPLLPQRALGKEGLGAC
jgi:hypothetical protein